jgi:hypothetical protein
MVYVYSNQNYWVLGLCSLSGILEIRKHNFSKLDLFPFSDEEEDFPFGFRAVRLCQCSAPKNQVFIELT